MSLKKRLNTSKLVVALSAGIVMVGASAGAHAATPSATIYGMLGIVGAYNTATVNGDTSSYSLEDNISQVGIKGDLGSAGTTKFIYDYDLSVDPTSTALTYLGTYRAFIGATGPWGTLKVGRLESTFLNDVVVAFSPFWWMYPTVAANFEQSQAISYVSPTMSGFNFSLMGFDLGKGSANGSKSTNNYALSGTYTVGDFNFGAGYEEFSKYGNGLNEYSASSAETVWGTGVNTYAGVLLKNKFGLRGTWASGPWSVSVGGFGFKPTSMIGTTSQNTDEILTYLATGTYAFNSEWTGMANVSSTSQSNSGVKGTIGTLSLAYSPISSVAFYAEYQYADKKAVESGLDSDVISNGTGTKSASQFVIGGTYSF